jgi:hypothetical protein
MGDFNVLFSTTDRKGRKRTTKDSKVGTVISVFDLSDKVEQGHGNRTHFIPRDNGKLPKCAN